MCTSSYRKRTSKFRKTREEKQLSGYKQCYACKNQSLEVSKYMNLAVITYNKLDPIELPTPLHSIQKPQLHLDTSS